MVRKSDPPKIGSPNHARDNSGSQCVQLPGNNPVSGLDQGLVPGDKILKNYRSILIAAGMLAISGGAAGAQTVGDWVLGNYKGAGYWFPGVAEKVQGGKVTIRYDDGDRETVSVDDVRPYNWTIGMKVECNYKNAGDWYGGTITSLGGEKIGIAYDDGDKEVTKTGRCRSR